MADRRLAAGLFVVVFAAYAWFFGGGGWNQNSQFDLTRAIVERGTFRIDAYLGNTYDIAGNGPAVYSNKAPGVSFLAVVPYAIALGVERALGVDVNSTLATTLNLYLCTVAVCAVSGALLAALVLLYGRRIGASAGSALIVAAALAFGTYLFAYSTVFLLHVPSALLLFWSFARLTAQPDDRPWIAGALGGMAVLCNYAALPAVAIVVVFAIAATGDRIRRGVAIVAGGLPFAIVLLAYQAICFGSPFRSSIAAESPIFHTKGAALGVLVAPRLDVLYAILLSRYRGLFFLSPVLVFAIAGAVIMIRRRIMVRELAAVLLISASFIALNISFNNWDGGSGVGPRYILPVVPFLALPMFFATGVLRPLFALLAAISFAFNLAATAVNPLPSRLVSDPIFRYTFPLLVTGRLPADVPAFPPLAWKRMLGHVSVNQVTADDLVAFHKHADGSPEASWASFNLGESFAPGSVVSIVPPVLWIVAGVATLIRRARRIDDGRGEASA